MSNRTFLLQTVFLILFIKTRCVKALHPRIVGGRAAKTGEFPYQVSIRRSTIDEHFCGGSIITPKHILTAAHCCIYPWKAPLPPKIVSVVVGQLDLPIKPSSIYRNATRIKIHPGFDNDEAINDIAIIELNRKLPLRNKLISKISLNRKPTPANLVCVVSGWGVLNFTSDEISDKLMATEVSLVDRQECQRRYNESEIPLFDGMLCAVNDKRPADACQGDSGGPLVCSGVLVGVVSTGSECGDKNYPGIYSDVRYFRPWIMQELSKMGDGFTTVKGEVTTKNIWPGRREETTFVGDGGRPNKSSRLGTSWDSFHLVMWHLTIAIGCINIS